MRFGSTAEVLAKCKLKYYRIQYTVHIYQSSGGSLCTEGQMDYSPCSGMPAAVSLPGLFLDAVQP